MRPLLVSSALILTLAGCGQASPPPAKAKAASPTPAAAAAPAPPVDARAADLDRINKASVDANAALTAPTPATSKDAAPAKDAKPASADKTPDPLLIRAEVLLDRARFSPGVVDGAQGTNLKHAIMAYQSAHAIDPSGDLDADTWKGLNADAASASARPAAVEYTVTAQDIAGPFAPDVGEDFVKLAAQPDGPLFATPLEALAERFHMSQALLQALNPAADFKTAGQVLVVVDAAPTPFAKGDVKTITVSKALAEITAFGPDGKVAANYPATVGSTEKPSPSGVHKVNGVARNPTYTYDPAKLNWGPRSHGKLIVKPGPNNPVGMVWIDLNAPSYGIHGTPDPDHIGKTASHGCVRLTNWDAVALAEGVKPGVMVTFEGDRGGDAKAAKKAK